MSARQLHILRVIEGLSSNATIAAIAKTGDRKLDVISRQAILLEKDGLIERIKDTPKSRLLTIKLTEKNLELPKVVKCSEGMKEVLSVLIKEERQQLDIVLNRLSVKLNEYTLRQMTNGRLKLPIVKIITFTLCLCLYPQYF
jgi:DNA-binding MarR family transcriptional regulator